ncbi:MAG: histidine utilization repressor [Desulfocapsaceae bacterium]|nr:histidine utilization repressor [Desulfocapsaceae bacterium]
MEYQQSSQNTPLYQQVKDYINNRIAQGILISGMRIESEAELSKMLNASRMTVNRALRELTAEGKLRRVQGLGTFVAEQKLQSPLFEIRSLAKEIEERGGRYSCDVHLLREEEASPWLAGEMKIQVLSPVFHSIIVHKEDGLPIQLGCRYINPEIAPDYLNQDYTRITPSDYLIQQAPVTAVEHVVEALIAEQWIRELLLIDSFEPCLVLHRKTWSGEQVATVNTFYYPGTRYTLGGRFVPDDRGKLDIV